MTTRTDILLDDTLDLVIQGNDFVMDASDNQHGLLLLSSKKGDWTQFPQTGVGMIQYLKGAFDGAARRNVQLQFDGDGYKVNSLAYDENTGLLNIDFQ